MKQAIGSPWRRRGAVRQRKGNVQLSEGDLIIRAIRNSILPFLNPEDHHQFTALIQDLFPLAIIP
jgi:hypothetical protein